MGVCCYAAIFIGWTVLSRDERNNITLDPLRVRLLGLIRNRLDLKLK